MPRGTKQFGGAMQRSALAVAAALVASVGLAPSSGTATAAPLESFTMPAAAGDQLPAVPPDITEVEAAPVDAATAQGIADPEDTVVASSDVTGFATAGVVWDGPSDPPGITISLRTARAGADWGDWEQVKSEPGPELFDDGGTAPILIGDVASVEAKVTGAAAAGITNVRLSVIDPGTGLVDARAALPVSSPSGYAAVVPATAPAAVPSAMTAPIPGMPPIRTRADWGADESLRTWAPRQGDFRGAVIHHTAGSNNYTAVQVPGILRGIYAFHAVTRGWGDIGYNFLVDRFGGIWEGRYGGVDRQTIGAHAVGWNTNTFGVSVLGNFETATVSNAAVSAVVDIVGWKFWRLGLRGTGQMTINNRTTSVVAAHREVGSTSCPGASLFARMGEIRTRVPAEVARLVAANPEVVLVGDWDGDGRDTLGIRRGNRFLLSNTFDGGNAEIELTFGRPDDVIIVGDWNGDGRDTLGVRRGNRYFLSNTFDGGNAEIELTFGRADDVIIVGDWNGDRRDTLGVRRGNRYFLSTTFEGGDAEVQLSFGRADDVIIVGDWNGDRRDTLGVRRGNRYLLSNTFAGGNAEIELSFGRAGDDILVGDWNGDRRDTLGIRRGNRYFLSNTFNGGNAEIEFTFGRS